MSNSGASQSDYENLNAQWQVVAHISDRGDICASLGAWVGVPGSNRAIQGFALIRQNDANNNIPILDYQISYDNDLVTPWATSPSFCGSRGLNLAIKGIRFRVSAKFHHNYDCLYDVSFCDGTKICNLRDTEFAKSSAAIDAIRIRILFRHKLCLFILNDLERRPDPPGGEISLDDPFVKLRLLSPPFGATPPTILNAERIHPGPRHAMDQSWVRRVFPPKDIPLRVIENANVVHQGLVFDNDLRIVPSTRLHHSDQDITQAREEIVALRSEGAVRRIRGTSVLCKSAAASNYGHYLVEMFPKAWIGKILFGTQHVTYILHQTDMMTTVADSLSLIGIKPGAIAWTNDEAVLCEKLITFDGLTYHGQYQSPLCARALSDLSSGIPAGKFRKILVRRRSNTRPLINEEAIENRLKKVGFHVVDPAEFTLKEQIEVFKGAEVVVAALGAALTNIAFCPKGTTVVALTSATFPDTFFWFLSQHYSHNYIEIRGIDARQGEISEEPWNAGFVISEGDISYLESL